MSTVEIPVPALPESVADATVLSWHRQAGDAVRQGDNLIDLETYKVVLEVPAPQDGVLSELRCEPGDLVEAGQILGVMETGIAAADKAAAKTLAASPRDDDSDVLAPAARRLVKEMGLDPADINGSGKDGRITKTDVNRYLQARQQQDGGTQAPSPPEPQSAKPPPVPAPAEKTGMTGEDGRPEQRVPMTRLRARVAKRLIQAQQNAAILTTFNEVNMGPVMDLRARYKDKFEKRHEVRLGFMSFFVKAAVEALKRFPVVNASVDGNDIIYHGYYDIGIAVSSPRGLVVPILRDADQLGFADIEQGIGDFAKKAKDGSLSYEDLSGGTFSITNGGIFGSMLSTPILNPPQSAILGMHNIKERAMVENGQVVVQPMMYLALSYDHRIIDGREAVQFLVTVKECLEDPARLLLQI